MALTISSTTSRQRWWYRLPGARSLAIAASAMVLIGSVVADSTVRLPDVLDTPTTLRATANRSTVTGIARSGQVLVAVGPRGMILRSADGAATWKQVTAPVGADFTSVRFSGPDTAWIVGHDSVILKSTDGGLNWERMLDGRVLLKTLTQAARTDPVLAKSVARTMRQSATPDTWPSALMDVHFVDADRGFAVGAFGLLLATEDAGKTWQPRVDRADNERQFHLYAMHGEGKQLYIAGEQGLLLRLDEVAQRFVRVKTPYNGSYFGVLVAGNQILAYGLRGNAYLSGDAGASWNRIETGTEVNLVGAGLLPGRLWVATQSGDILTGPLAAGKLERTASLPGPDVYGAVALDAGRLAVARLNGVVTVNAQLAN